MYVVLLPFLVFLTKTDLATATRQYISRATRGHAGLMRFYVHYLIDKFHEASGRVSDDEILAAIMDPAFIFSVSSSRIFPPHAQGPQQRLLRELINKGRALALASGDAMYDVAVALAKQGMVLLRQQQGVEEVDFAAPVVRQVVLSRFINPNLVTQPLASGSSLAQLIELALMRCDS